MFDNQPPSPPSNLPVGNPPDDILGDEKENSASAPPPSFSPHTPLPQSKTTPNSDLQSGGVSFKGGQMVSGPSALDVGKIKPVDSVPPTVPHGEPIRDTGVVVEESFASRHKLLLFGLIALVILIPLVWAGMSLFLRGNEPAAPSVILKAPDTDTSDISSFETSSSAVSVPSTTTEEGQAGAATSTPTDATVPPGEASTVTPPQETTPDSVDADGDGLTLSQELQYGTDPSQSDSDSDGLTDKEEINIWKTDPRNSDSDSDTYSDGQEVKNGYNPLGSGRLFEIPKQ